MQLTRHHTEAGPRWAADNVWLTTDFTLDWIMGVPGEQIGALVAAASTGDTASGNLLAPVENDQEIWASGVTYLRSREARMQESDTADIYDKVYAAIRPELFFKCLGWRACGPGANIRVRKDATWNVPEPELVLVSNAAGQIIGYTAGNDVSSRDIEGENPLYLPQAKVFNGSCGLGPAIIIADEAAMSALPIRLRIDRSGASVFDGTTGIDQMKRSLSELTDTLYSELHFPNGSFLLTGAGIVPADDFNLTAGDEVTVDVGDLQLINPVGV
jgi:2-dehydro-3-deoxy-D-arabinonate dehydratase